MRTPAFWFVSGAFFLASMATVGVLQHQASFLRDFALAPTIAALGVGITAGIGGVGKLAYGYLADRMPVRYTALISFGSQAGALTLLLTTQQTWALWAYIVLFGIGMGAIVVLVPLLIAEIFGVQSFGAIFGTVNLVQGLGLAIGPWAAGMIFDIVGSYTPAFQASLALYAGATLLVFLARRPRQTISETTTPRAQVTEPKR
jgi:MFS family permease